MPTHKHLEKSTPIGSRDISTLTSMIDIAPPPSLGSPSSSSSSNSSNLSNRMCWAFSFLTLSVCAIMINLSSAWARPTTRIVSQDEGDASVSLALESQYVNEDAQLPCELNVEVLGESRPFTEGDTILIRVREDDAFLGDDTLWETSIVVDEAIVELQLFTMTYDCSFAAVDDQFADIEVYASVEVDKQDCGRLCELSFGEDTPSTPNIYMRRVDDDDAEDDDESAEAFVEPQRLTADRVARDPDWFIVEYGYSVELLARLESKFAGGDLSLKLYDSALDLIVEASLETGGVSKSLRPPSVLLPGRYYLEVTPTDPANFNFYDLYIVESQVMVSCPQVSLRRDLVGSAVAKSAHVVGAESGGPGPHVSARVCVSLVKRRARDAKRGAVAPASVALSVSGAPTPSALSAKMARWRAVILVLQRARESAHVLKGHAPVVVANGRAVRVMYCLATRSVSMLSIMIVMDSQTPMTPPAPPRSVTRVSEGRVEMTTCVCKGHSREGIVVGQAVMIAHSGAYVLKSQVKSIVLSRVVTRAHVAADMDALRSVTRERTYAHRSVVEIKTAPLVRPVTPRGSVKRA